VALTGELADRRSRPDAIFGKSLRPVPREPALLSTEEPDVARPAADPQAPGPSHALAGRQDTDRGAPPPSPLGGATAGHWPPPLASTRSTVRIPSLRPQPARHEAPGEVTRQPRQSWDRELRVNVRASVVLQAGVGQRRVRVDDPRICDVVQFGRQELAVVGKQPGSTLVHLESEGQEEATRPVTFLVRVGPDPKEQQDNQDEYARLNKLLGELFPQSQVEVAPQEDRLIVTGRAKDRQEAIEILTLVREMRLIPVINRLVVDERRSSSHRRTLASDSEELFRDRASSHR
jgi:hypothetical protein